MLAKANKQDALLYGALDSMEHYSCSKFLCVVEGHDGFSWHGQEANMCMRLTRLFFQNLLSFFRCETINLWSFTLSLLFSQRTHLMYLLLGVVKEETPDLQIENILSLKGVSFDFLFCFH